MENFSQDQLARADETAVYEAVPAHSECHYHSSSKINLLRFLPLFLLAGIVTLVMSFLLLMADWFYYLFLIMPILIGLPVAGMIYVVIHAGRCRNSVLGRCLGIYLMLQYYLGFWGLGYLAFMGGDGYQEGTRILMEQTGTSGVWGYFQLHCQGNIIQDTTMPVSKDKEPDAFDKYSSYTFYGMELIFLVVIGYACSNGLSRRVFYEHRKKWATSKSICFLPADLLKLIEIVTLRDWTRLEEMPRFAKFGNQQTRFAELVIEYCKGFPQEPVYLSVKGTGLKKIARQAGMVGKGLLQKNYIGQLELPGETISILNRVLGGLKIGSQRQPQPDHRSAVSPKGGACDSRGPAAQAVPLTESGQVGHLSSNSGQPDFRQEAIAESLRVVPNANAALLRTTQVSVCLPVGAEACVSVKRIAFYPMLLIITALVAIFGGLGIAVWGTEMTVPGTEDLTAGGYVLVVFGGGLFLSSFFFLFFSKSFQMRKMKRMFLERFDALFEARGDAKMVVSNIESTKTYHVFKFAPDDVGLVCFDVERQRLLIEGCTHRYVICGRDVLQLEPVQSHSENVICLTYQIGQAKLSLTLTCESMKKAFLNQTIFGVFKGRSSQKYADELKQVLGME